MCNSAPVQLCHCTVKDTHSINNALRWDSVSEWTAQICFWWSESPRWASSGSLFINWQLRINSSHRVLSRSKHIVIGSKSMDRPYKSQKFSNTIKQSEENAEVTTTWFDSWAVCMVWNLMQFSCLFKKLILLLVVSLLLIKSGFCISQKYGFL